jgi:hypothetical protein
VGSHPWLSLPQPANTSDDYITQFARAVASRLAPNLRVYVEYGTQGPGFMNSHQVGACCWVCVCVCVCGLLLRGLLLRGLLQRGLLLNMCL